MQATSIFPLRLPGTPGDAGQRAFTGSADGVRAAITSEERQSATEGDLILASDPSPSYRQARLLSPRDESDEGALLKEELASELDERRNATRTYAMSDEPIPYTRWRALQTYWESQAPTLSARSRRRIDVYA